MTNEVPEQTPESLPEFEDPQLRAFVEVCQTLMRFDGDTEVSFVDGYLTAIAASRRIIDTGEWLPALAGEAFERAYADPEAAAVATQSLENWLKLRRSELAPEILIDRPDHCLVSPLFDEWTEEMRAELLQEGDVPVDEVMALQTGSMWSQGFLTCVRDFADDWPSPDDGDESADAEAYFSMIELIACVSLSPDHDVYKDFAASQWRGNPPTRDELLDEVCFAVQDLRLYWLDHGPKPEQRIAGDKPGRNDPCPCGSGKKYKKCHGA